MDRPSRPSTLAPPTILERRLQLVEGFARASRNLQASMSVRVPRTGYGVWGTPPNGRQGRTLTIRTAARSPVRVVILLAAASATRMPPAFVELTTCNPRSSRRAHGKSRNDPPPAQGLEDSNGRSCPCLCRCSSRRPFQIGIATRSCPSAATMRARVNSPARTVREARSGGSKRTRPSISGASAYVRPTAPFLPRAGAESDEAFKK